jgi:hypothetical protein
MTATGISQTARSVFMLVAATLFSVAMQASNAQSSDVGKGFGFEYDSTKEIKVAGIVQEVISHPARGSAVGLHLLVSAQRERVDAHLGPFLSVENRAALAPGVPIEIIGVNASSHGHNLFLVRQLTIGERQIAIRNQRGFLIREAPHRNTQSRPVVNGGVQ